MQRIMASVVNCAGISPGPGDNARGRIQNAAAISAIPQDIVNRARRTLASRRTQGYPESLVVSRDKEVAIRRVSNSRYSRNAG